MRAHYLLGSLFLVVVLVFSVNHYARIIRGIRGDCGPRDNGQFGPFDDALYECFGIGSPSPAVYTPRPAVSSGVQGNPFNPEIDFPPCEVQF